jgi:hypothetical protein
VSLWPSKQRNGTSSGAFARSLEPKLGTISNYQTVSKAKFAEFPFHVLE